MKRRGILGSVLLGLWGQAIGISVDDYPEFAAARDAFYRKDVAQIRDIQAQVGQRYLLSDYLEYWRLKASFDQVSMTEVFLFLQQHGGSHLGISLREAWLAYALKQEKFDQIRLANRLFQVNRWHLSPQEQCSVWHAQHASGREAQHLQQAATWFSNDDLPRACDALMLEVARSRWVTEQQRWQRVWIYWERSQLSWAKQFVQQIQGAPTEAALSRAYRHPGRYVNKSQTLNSPAKKNLFLLAVARVARKRPAQAAQSLSLAVQKYRFAEFQLKRTWQSIALSAALKHMPEAQVWFEKAEGSLNAEGYQWYVRAALRLGDWRTVIRVVNNMPLALFRQPVWQYWLGRAYWKMGRPNLAHQLWSAIAKDTSYYSILATEALGGAVNVGLQRHVLQDAEVQDALRALQQEPQLKKATLLFYLGERRLAIRAWNSVVQQMSGVQKIAAAELARQRGLPDRMVQTSIMTDVGWYEGHRYPVLFRSIVDHFAKKTATSPAWIYATIRQESRFMQGVYSSSGAAGLMQVMPKTARWIAQKVALDHYQEVNLTVPQVNIEMGSYYVSYLNGLWEADPVLVAASYNAGPSRAKKWRDSQRLDDRAIFVETIPFKETRLYVKHVLSNYVVYQRLLSEASRTLHEVLGAVTPGGV